MISEDENTQAPPVDFDYLADLRLELASPDEGDESDPIIELLDIFIASAEKSKDAMVEASAAGDLETVAKLSHQLVSSCSWVGAYPLAALNRSLEQDARAGKTGLTPQVEAVGTELQRVLYALKALREEIVE